MADIQTNSPRKHPGHTQPSGSGLSSISETEVSVSVSSPTNAEARDLDTEMTGMQAAMAVAADTDGGNKEGNSKNYAVTPQEGSVREALSEANIVLDLDRKLAGMDGHDINNGDAIQAPFTNVEQSLNGHSQPQPEPQSQTLAKQPPLSKPRSQSQSQTKSQQTSAKASSASGKPTQANGGLTNNTTQAKPDKPRPHVCTTCNRSFARLEHLKRHERSHTKEKPFECPECTRCFARRDLLLRHQQKLHMNSAPASRGRGRRESASNGALGNASRSGVGGVGAGSAAGSMPGAGSTAGATGGRVRKNSIVNGGVGARPRANTISHVDGRAFELMANAAITGASSGNDIRIRNAHAAPPVSGPAGRARHPPRGAGHLRGQVPHHSSFSGIAGLPGSGLFNPQPLDVTPENVQAQHHGLPSAGQQPQHHATASHLQPHQQHQQQARPIHGLAKLDTANIPIDMHELRTAPIGDSFNTDAAMFDFMSQGVVAGNGTTINPAQLFFDPSSSNGAPLNLIHHETAQQYHNHHDQQQGGLQNGGAGFQAASAPSTSVFAAMFERQQQQFRQQNQNQNQDQNHQHQQQQQQQQQHQGLGLSAFDPMAIDFSAEDTTLPFELFTTAAGSTDPNATLDSTYNMFFGPGTIPKSTVDGSSPSAFSTGSQSGVSGVSDSMFDGSTHTLTTVATNASGSTIGNTNGKVPTTTTAGWNQGGNDMLVNNSLSFGIDFSSPFGATGVEHGQGQQNIQPQQHQFHQQQQTQQQHQQRHGLQNDTVSPRNLFSQANTQVDTSHFLATSAPQNSIFDGLQQQAFPHGLVTGAEYPNMTGEINENIAAESLGHENFLASPPASAADGSARRLTNQSTLTSGLQQSIGNSGQTYPAGRRYSQASVNLLATENNISPSSIFSIPTMGTSLPSTCDMQRYVIAYIQYFHPHLPFLHIPTMNFDTSEFTNSLRMAMDQQSGSSPNFANGRACLLLSMAAIGALFEFEVAPSMELFETAKKLIQTYLEQKRKADMNAAFHRAKAGGKDEMNMGSNGTPNSNICSSQTAADGQEKPTGHNIPLWLIQAMLLNVIYGHNSGDKAAASIASTHCAALVSLARASELISHVPVENLSAEHVGPYENTNAGEDKSEERLQWLRWKVVEERKRTLFAIFTLSSLLLSAYNHAPALMNSEIQLNLPCDEQSWAAQTPQSWMATRNAQDVKEQEISFPAALTILLGANQRDRNQSSSSPNQNTQRSSSIEQLNESELKPSTFGCLVLIHALHNYIWETRQRHVGRPWTSQETDAMHAHIEPALRAWQCAWKSNPQHSIERPNLSGIGPLSADSIPLLDLAYVRLFVNLARSKEAFWQRDWELMAEEMARGAEIVEHAGEDVLSPANGNFNNQASGTVPAPVAAATKALASARRPSVMMDYGLGDLNLGGSSPSNGQPLPTTTEGEVLTLPELGIMGNPTFPTQTKASRRERHLRKAAFYAADSMFMSDKLGATFAEYTSRELPLQYALCAFDCAQVLAEWVTTVQERIGSYLGILGEDHIELGQVPAIMFLEDEDIKLLGKIEEILGSVEAKMRKHAFSSSVTEAGTPSNFNMGMSLGTSQAGLNDSQPLNGRHESWDCPPSLLNGGYGIKILFSTAYLLNRAAVWPVTKLMAKSLEVQGMKMRERARQSVGRDIGINTTCGIPVI